MKGIIYHIIIFTLLCCTKSVYAQSALRGKIVDKADNKPLANASLILLNQDSILRYFVRSDESGKFQFKTVVPGSYILLATYPKFEIYNDTIVAADNDMTLEDIKINSQRNVLEEVIVTRRLPITLKGDTIEYDAASFETEKNAKLEDLLRRLPGFTVTGDGTITAQGKTVQKVFIDGEEFFGYDPKIAIRNVRADAVDKVQFYEKKSEEAELSGIDDGVRIQTVNVVLKEEAREGIFGNVEGLAGTESLYAGNLFGAKFNHGERLGITANHNNMGNSNGREGSLRMNNLVTGEPRFTSIGANYENQFLKKALRVNANYNFNDNENKNERESYNKRVLPNDIIQETRSNNRSENSNQSNGLRSNFKWRLDSIQNLELQLNAGISKGHSSNTSNSSTVDGQGADISDFTENNQSDNDANSNEIRVNYRRRLKAGKSINVMLGNNYSTSSSVSKVSSRTEFYTKDSTAIINQNRTGDNFQNNFSTSVNFNNRISTTINFAVGYSFSNSNSRNKQNSYDFQTNEFDSLYSQNQIDKNNNHGINLNASFRKEPFEINFSNRTFYKDQRLQDSYRNIDLQRNFWDNNVNLDANYKISNTKNIRLSYQNSFEIPSFSQLQPLQPQTNPLYQQLGNPDLKRAVNNNIRGNYNTFSMLKGTSLNINADFTFINDPIINKTTIDSDSRTTSTYVNLNNKTAWNTGVYINHMQSLFNRRVNFNKMANLRFSNSYNYIKFGSADASDSYQLNNAQNTNFNLGVSANEQDSEGFDFDLTINAGLNNQNNTINQDYNYTNFEASTSAYVKYFLPKKFNITTNAFYSYTGPTKLYRSAINQFYMNMEIGKKVLKDESLTISVKAFDLFNTYNNTQRSVNDTSYGESIQQVLTRYILVGLKWDFNKYLGKKND